MGVGGSTSPQKDEQIANKHTKMYSTTSAIEAMQIKTSMEYHPTPTRMNTK